MTVRSLNVREGWIWEGKRSGGWEKANKKRKNGETYLSTWTVCENFVLIVACLTMSNIV